MNGKIYESAINAEQFDRIRDLGVNIVLGPGEGFGTPQAEENIVAMRLCAERDMYFLPRDELAREYVSAKWNGLTCAEKTALDARFENSLRGYCEEPGFGGLLFWDEPGATGFPGIAAAKRVFARVCPGKLFYVTMYGHCITPEQFQGEGEPEPCFCEEPKEKRYSNFMSRYLREVEPEIYSYDLYPMVSLGGIATTVHRALYDLPLLAKSNLRASGRNIPLWCFLQAGGRWEGSLGVRVPVQSEVLLQVNALLALGVAGLEIFPYYFPACWEPDREVVAGLVDVRGNPTALYPHYRRALASAIACQEVFTGYAYKGFFLAGKFNGLLPPEETLKTVLWEDCIYRGGIESEENIGYFPPILRTESTSEALVGCFEGEYPAVWVVNNSITAAANVALFLDAPRETEIVREGVRTREVLREVRLDALEAGAAALVVFKEKREQRD